MGDGAAGCNGGSGGPPIGSTASPLRGWASPRLRAPRCGRRGRRRWPRRRRRRGRRQGFAVVVVGGGDRCTSLACTASGIMAPSRRRHVVEDRAELVGDRVGAGRGGARQRRRSGAAGARASGSGPGILPSDRDLDRLAGLLGQPDDRGGDGEVLQADAGAVEEGDLVGERRPGWVPLMTAPIWVIADSAIRPAAMACWASPIETDWATSSVKTVARGEQRGLDLLLALGVGAHAGEVGAGLDLGGHQDRGEASR